MNKFVLALVALLTLVVVLSAGYGVQKYISLTATAPTALEQNIPLKVTAKQLQKI